MLMTITPQNLGIGFTGNSSVGMAAKQEATFLRILNKYLEDYDFHHGMCVQSDEQAHHIVREHFPNTHIIGHPPEDESKMANLKCDELRPALPYLKRNMQIVIESKILIATPKTAAEQVRSGTWATIRYAERLQVPALIIFPNGSIAKR